MKWENVLNKVVEIKKKYTEKNDEIIYDLEQWVKELNTPDYTEFLKPLQITHHGKYVLLRYGQEEFYNSDWKNPDSYLRHCRSIVIDLDKEQVVIYPFEKFFNINELEETSVERIQSMVANAEVFEVADKLDGSMYAVRYMHTCGCNSGCGCDPYSKLEHGELITCTSRSLDENNSWRLEDANRMLKESEQIVKMITDNSKYTFVFEYISQEDAHVVRYETEGIYLIGMTDMETGVELNYSEVSEFADRYQVKSTSIENLTLGQLIEKSKSHQAHEKEGWVLNIDGYRVKVKCEDYVNMHRLLGSLTSVNVIIEAIAEDKYDDFISKVPEAYRSDVEYQAKEIFKWLKVKTAQINDAFEKAPKSSRKEFMIWTNQLDRDIQAYVRNKYNGKTYNLLKKGPNGYRKLGELEGLGDIVD